MGQQQIVKTVFLTALLLLLWCKVCSGYTIASGPSPALKVRRSDDSTLQDLESLLQQQSAVNQQQSTLIQQQSAVIQTLQAKMTTVENQIAKLQQSVVFTANFNSGGIIHIGESSLSPFSHVAVNLGNGYDPTSGVFTAPISGAYLFYLQVQGTGTIKNTEKYAIVKSGTVVTYTDLQLQVDGNQFTSIFITTHVKAGEKVYARSYSGATTIHKWYETSFSGILLKAD